MSTEIQFANNNESFADDECIEFDIESIIDGFDASMISWRIFMST